MSEQSYYVRDRGRVTGPHTLAQLQMLVKRGAVSRISVISTTPGDARSWLPAGSMPELFPPRKGAREEGVSGGGGGGAVPGESQAAVWFYLANGHDSAGPVSPSYLRGQIANGQAPPDVLVWRDGFGDWQPASSVAELAPRVAPRPAAPAFSPPPALPAPSGGGAGRAALLVVAVTLCVLTVTAAGLFAFGVIGPRRAGEDPESGKLEVALQDPADARPGKRPADPKKPGKPPAEPDLITTLDDEKRIREAVGLVVCGRTIRWNDGDLEDVANSSGSCFAVTPDGYLITNRHVIKDMEPKMRMSPEYKIADYCREKLLEVKEAVEAVKKEGKTVNEETVKNLIATYSSTSRFKAVEPKIWVFFGSREEMYEAEIVHVSSYDMGILKVKRGSVPYFRMADETQLPRIRTKVYSLGFPGAARVNLSDEEANLRAQRTKKNVDRIQDQFQNDDFNLTSAPGEVSRFAGEGPGGRHIQHTADINHGNSGGPLVDGSDATVVGINTLFVKKKDDASALYYSLSTPQMLKEINREIDKYRSGVR